MNDIEIVLLGLPYHRAHLTGSNFICNPPVLDTDIDIVVWATHADFERRALGVGWMPSEEYGPGMRSYRRGIYNLIVLVDQSEFYRWIGATYTAKLLNLKEKGDRIRMFDCIVYQAPLGKVF